VALLPLLVALSRPRAGFAAPRPLRAFGLGLTAGIVYFSGTLYWLTDVMVTFGGLSSPIAIVLAGLLIAYLALFPALFSVAFAFIQRRFRADTLLIAPALWVTSELGRAYILTGFPWVLLGYSQTPVLPIAQIASLFGVYGLSALVCAVSAVATYAIWRDGRPRRVAIGAIAATLIVGAAWGTLRLRDSRLAREGEPVNVGIVQGNVAQGQKWDRAFAKQIFDSYVAMSREVAARGAKLIVWPESSTPFMFERDPVGAETLRQLTRESGAYLLFGSDQFEAPPAGPVRVYNSAFLLRPDGLVSGVYKKMHLVPFGEYVPFKRLLFFVAPLVEGVGDFEAGERVDVLRVGDQSLSTAICYEAVFPELARAAVQGGSRLLTTITNDAWYGESSAPHQHFEMARLRAVEQGRYLVRSANTGISGVVDPYGRVLLRTDLFVPAAVNAEARYLDDQTVYARIGDAFAYACVAVTLWALLASRGARV
jgi:apolipoprotein N-acyltransferase